MVDYFVKQQVLETIRLGQGRHNMQDISRICQLPLNKVFYAVIELRERDGFTELNVDSFKSSLLIND